MVSMLNSIEGVVCPEPEGAFYAFPSFAGLIGREIGGRTITSGLDLAAVALERALVAFVPGEAFGAAGAYGRFSYATSDDAIAAGIGRLVDLVSRGS